MPKGTSDDLPAKAEKLANDARAAGEKFMTTDAGKKVGDMADTAFSTADEMGRKIAGSELGRKALESDFGKQAKAFAQDANASAKTKIPNSLTRNVAIGAAAGAVIALPVPIIGPIIGALIGGGIGYLRSITRKSGDLPRLPDSREP